MQKTRARRKQARPEDFDVHGDIAKIKAALTNCSRDIRGKAGAMMSESFNDAREKSSEIQENVSDYVSERPMKSLGLAVLTGAILGYILHR